MKYLDDQRILFTKRSIVQSLFAVFFILILLPLCGFVEKSKNSEDVYFPRIKLQSPGPNLEVLPGTVFSVNAVLEDNQALESYQVNISKGGAPSDKYRDAFSVYRNLDANGNSLPQIGGAASFELNFDVKVNSSAIVGDYIFSLAVKDKAGNEHVIKRYFYVRRP